MKILFLGTNGWYTSPTGNTACILIDSHDRYIILDAGNGIYKLDNYITENKPIALFISHFHIDHVSGLHTLAKFSFQQGLDIFIGEGRKKDFETLINPPYTVGIEKKEENILQLPMDIRLHELSVGNHQNPFPIEVIEQHHAYKNHGYRLTIENKIIAYSGDCGITEKSSLLAKNADVLIHECSLKNAPKDNTWGHVDPIQAAQLAKDSGVKKLLLTHFDPTQYTTLADRKTAEKRAQEIFPKTTTAEDDMEITV